MTRVRKKRALLAGVRAGAEVGRDLPPGECQEALPLVLIWKRHKEDQRFANPVPLPGICNERVP